MITIADILRPEHVLLDLNPAENNDVVWDIAMLLKTDDRVQNWSRFYESLKTTSIEAGPGVEICIPHARTKSVGSMVMSAGRVSGGVSPAGSAKKIRYIFVIGIPVAFASDYLRIIGSVARMFKSQDTEGILREVRSPEQFVAILSGKEMQL